MFIGINMGIVGSLMGGASILALFASGEVGVWFDPTDITTLYQDINALTQVSAPGQTCALMLDKSKGLVLGSNILSTAWTMGFAGASTATNSPPGTIALFCDGTNAAYAEQSVATEIGVSYRITLTTGTGNILTIAVGTTQGGGTLANLGAPANTANYTFIFTATTTTTWIKFLRGAGGTCNITNISAQKVPGYHAVQATAAQRPTYGVIPYGGVRNLANGSGAVGDAAYWPASVAVNGITAAKVGSGTDANGLPYVDIRYTGTATGTSMSSPYVTAQSDFPTTTGNTFTSSLLVTRIAGTMTGVTGIRPQVSGRDALGVFLEGSGGTPVSGDTETLTSQSFTMANALTVKANSSIVLVMTLAATIDVTYRLKAFQFEKAAARSAFQLNLSKYNVTEAGKASLGVLYPDGIDDWMVTPSINFSGTDKVTIWAGLQKMSDAAQALLAELSVSTGGNPNTFGLQAATPNPATFRFVSAGSATGSGIAEIAGYPATTVAVITGIGDISAPKASIIVNNSATVTSAVSQGTGNYSSNPIYLFRRGGASLPFNGIFTGLIVRGAASSAAQISNANAFLNSELGAY